MENFSTFFAEQEKVDNVQGLLHELEGGIDPQKIKNVIQQSGAKTIDEFIQWLLKSEPIIKFRNLYQKNSHNECVLEEGIGNVLVSSLKWIAKKFLASAVALLKHMFKPFAGEGEGKFVYAAQLLFVFFSGIVLVGVAAPTMGLGAAATAVGATAIPAGNIMAWVIMWIGNTFLKPALQALDI